MKISIEKTALIIAVISTMSCNPEGLSENQVEYRGISAYTFENGVVIYEPGWERFMYLDATPGLASFSELYRVEEGERLYSPSGGSWEILSWILPGREQNASSELLAMSVPVDEKDGSRTETLLRINPENGTVIRYEVDSLFDKIGFDANGRFAVMYHGGDVQGANLSNIALIDLTEPPGEANPHIMSISLGGRPIKNIFFTPLLKIDSSSKAAGSQLAVFTSDGAVRVVDLADPENSAVTVPLTTEDDERTVRPVQVVTRNVDSTRYAKIFVRADGSEDVYCISLFTDTDGKQGLSATVSLLEAGGEPLDMVVVEDGNTPLLVALGKSSGSSPRLVSVVNIDTEDFFHVNIDDVVDRVFLRGAAGKDQEAVLFGDNSSAVHYLKADGLATDKESNLSQVLIPDRIERVTQIDNDRLIIDSSATSDLIVFDINTRLSIRLSGGAGFNSDPLSTSIILGDKLFMGPSGDDSIFTLDMATGHADELLLDESISSFHVLSGSGAGVILHDVSTGRATVFDLSEPTRSNAFVVDGLWLKGFLD